MTELQPGHLEQLPTDEHDAGAILLVAKALSSMSPGVFESSLIRVLREAIYFTWEQPRLPKPLVQGKYPRAFPWSADAREILEQHQARPTGGYGLVFEHVIPKHILCSTLLSESQRLTCSELVRSLHDGIAVAIVSKREDQQLPKGLDRTLAEYLADPWLRYRGSGVDLSRVAPLSQ